jgi:oxygen-independent coproporphyrinogen-3 oxidase
MEAAARETIRFMRGLHGDALGLYLSIPFCRSKCTWCNFASGVYPASDHERYVDRLIEDLAAAPAWAAQSGVALPRAVDTVYLGGGTPNLLAPELLASLFAAIRLHFEVEPDAEITVECAPGQLSDATLAALAEAGVNRVSLGVQSFIDREAAVSGRLHNRAVVMDDIRCLRAAGIANLSVDLIAGLAGQTFATWRESLAVLADTGVPHASIYMLEVDEDSRLGREILSGGVRYHACLVPSEDSVAQMYLEAIEMLAAAGLPQYEISNFSRPGAESRHNLRYWQRRPYLGLGLDASSMLRESGPNAQSRVLRATTTDDLAAFLRGPEPPETTWLASAQQHEEAWFLGLRLNGGVDVAALEREFGCETAGPALEIAAHLIDDGLLSSNGPMIRLTPRGRMFSNDVFQHFIEMQRELTSHQRV